LLNYLILDLAIMKIKKADGTILEVADDYELQEGEEKVEEEEEG